MTSKDKQPSVYAIVLNYNGAEDTERCISSLERSGYQNLHIVLVDNSSPDGSGDLLAEKFSHLPLLRTLSNNGYAGGNNIGIRYALERNADFILIINNDVVVEHGFLSPMVELLNRDHGIGAVNAKVFYSSHRDQVFSAAGKLSRILCTGLNNGLDKELLKSATYECEVDYVCGVLLLVRTQVFLDVGLLDETFFMYFEDIEFSRRVRLKYRLAYTSRAVAYHKSGGGKGWKSYSEIYLYYHTRNRLWVFRKEMAVYRWYVVLYSVANCLGKAFAIFLNLQKDRQKVKKQLRALYKGFLDGLTKPNLH